MDNELVWMLVLLTFFLFVLLLGAALVMIIYNGWKNKNMPGPRMDINRGPETGPEDVFEVKEEYYVLTCYEVLGVKKSADPARIEQAYRDRLRMLKTKGKQRGDADWKMKLDQARDVLLDPGMRKEYDEFLKLRDKELLISVAVDKPPYGTKFKRPRMQSRPDRDITR